MLGWLHGTSDATPESRTLAEGTRTYQVRILPEHGPGAIARTARRVHSSPFADRPGRRVLPEVEIRDLGIYETLSPAGVWA